jgi:hypothetical protein
MYRDYNQVFTVAKTYAIVTEDSAARGDYAEHGYIYDAKPMSLREIMQEIDNLGSCEIDKVFDNTIRLYGIDSITDYEDTSETTEALHIRGSKRAMKRLEKVLKLIK